SLKVQSAALDVEHAGVVECHDRGNDAGTVRLRERPEIVEGRGAAGITEVARAGDVKAPAGTIVDHAAAADPDAANAGPVDRTRIVQGSANDANPARG